MSRTGHIDNLNYSPQEGTEEETHISNWTVEERRVHRNCPQCNVSISKDFIKGGKGLPIEASKIQSL
jgi:rubredoxin